MLTRKTHSYFRCFGQSIIAFGRRQKRLQPARVPTVALLTLVSSASLVHGQLPQPMRNQNFSQPAPGSSNLRTVQAYERVGKRVLPSQPTGRTVLQRTHASPWLERFIKPKPQPNTNHSGPSAAAPNQPPLANVDTQTTSPAIPPRSSGTTPTANRGSQTAATTPGQSLPGQTRPTQLLPPQSQAAGRSSQTTGGSQWRAQTTDHWDRAPAFLDTAPKASYGTGSKFDANASQSARRNQPAESSSIGIGSLPTSRPIPPRAVTNAPDSSRNPTAQPANKPSPTATATAQTPGAAAGKAAETRQQEALPITNSAPSVARVPLPTSPSDAVADPPSPSDALSTPPAGVQNQPVEDTARDKVVGNPTSSKDAPSSTQTGTSPTAPGGPAAGSVTVPTKLVNTPTSESAARKQFQNLPPTVYMTTQLSARNPSAEKRPAEKTATADAGVAPTAPVNHDLPPLPTAAGPTAKPSPTSDQAAIPSLPGLPELPASTDTAARGSTNNQPPVDITNKPSSNDSLLPASTPQPSAPELPGKQGLAQGESGAVPQAGLMQPAMLQGNSQSTATGNDKPTASGAKPGVGPNAIVRLKTGGATQTQGPPARQRTELPTLPRVDASPLPASQARINMQAPRLQVMLQGPKNLQRGDNAEYKIVALNQDQIDLPGLILRAEVPAGVELKAVDQSAGQIDLERVSDGATLVTWAVDSVPAGKTATLPLRVLAKQAVDFDIGIEWTLVPLTQRAGIHVISPELQLALSGAKEVVKGQSSVYQLKVSNVGEGIANNIALQINAGGEAAKPAVIGSLAPGASETVEIELDFTRRGTITVQVDAATDDKVSKRTEMDIQVRQSQLVAAIAAPKLVYHGNAVDYRVTLRNEGDAATGTATAILHLPPSAQPIALAYGAEHVTTVVPNQTMIRWNVDNLPPGEQREYAFRLSLPREGENQVRLEAKGESDLHAETEVTTIVQAIADLKLLVSDPVAPAPVGAEVNYQLEVTNRGSKAARNVRVIAQFSQGIEPVRSSGHAGRVVPGQVYFDPIPSIEAGQTVKLQVIAKADSGGVHRFRAEVRAEDTEVRLVQEESTQFLKSDLQFAQPPTASPLR